MRSQYRYSRFALGVFGQIMVGFISFTAIFSLCSISPWFLILVPLPIGIIFLEEIVILDSERRQYFKGLTVFVFVKLSDWKPLHERCFLKIELISEVHGIGMHGIEFGTVSNRSIGLFFMDARIKSKVFLINGTLTQMETEANKIQESLGLNIKNTLT